MIYSKLSIKNTEVTPYFALLRLTSPYFALLRKMVTYFGKSIKN